MALPTEIQLFSLNKYAWIIPRLCFISRALKNLTLVCIVLVEERTLEGAYCVVPEQSFPRIHSENLRQPLGFQREVICTPYPQQAHR